MNWFPTIVILASTVMLCGSIGQSDAAGIKVVAHRGASHDAPENTLAAFNLAFEQGTDFVETDLHLTKDNRVVLSHDGSTKRTGDKEFVIADHALAELKQVDVGVRKGRKWAGQRIPTIEEALAIIPAGKGIYLDIKVGPAIIAPLEKALCNASLAPQQVVFIDFDLKTLAAIKRRFAAHRAFWLVGFHRDKKTKAWRPSLDEVLSKARAAKIDGLDVEANAIVDRSLVEKVQAAGLAFHVWTVDSPSTVAAMFQAGVASITTNRPQQVRTQLRESSRP
jgi:glycerophosphoryl diester phosphodiesterase